MRCIQSLFLIALLTLPAIADEPTFDIPRLGRITIDGDPSDWRDDGLRVAALAPSVAPIPAVSDLHASFRLAWNATGLLVLAEVSDDFSAEAEEDGSLYEGDSVELFLSPERGAPDIYQIVVAPGLSPDHPQMRHHVYDNRQDSTLLQTSVPLTLERRRTATGYILEALLPFANLGTAPAEGSELAFQIVVNDVEPRQDRYQLMWYPLPGAFGSSLRMYPLRLADRPSPPILAAAAGDYERFRRVRVDVAAAPELAGQRVEIKAGRKRLARGELGDEGVRSAASLSLPMPRPDKPYPPLSVRLGKKIELTVELPDLEESRARALQETQVECAPFLFAGSAFPPCGFAQPSLVEDIVGLYSLTVTYYDADYRAVTRAEKPGRYGAVVEVTPVEGAPFKRYLTLFRTPEVDWSAYHPDPPAVALEKLGIPAPLIASHAESLSDFFKWNLIESLEDGPEAASLLAGLHSLPPDTQPRERNAYWELERQWIYGLKKSLGDAQVYEHLLYLPADYDRTPQKEWPLLLFLHGSGERGDDLEKVKFHGPPKLIEAGQDFPFIVVSPQCPEGEWWLPVELIDLIDQVSARYRVDPSRIYLTGLSMGGYGTWSTAVQYPDRFAALAPICGGGDPRDVERIARIPSWVFHGALDSTVPLQSSQEMVEALEQKGAEVKFTVYPEADHDSWTVTYDNPALYEWLLQHRIEER